jgi:hypothetical protein
MHLAAYCRNSELSELREPRISSTSDREQNFYSFEELDLEIIANQEAYRSAFHDEGTNRRLPSLSRHHDC